MARYQIIANTEDRQNNVVYVDASTARTAAARGIDALGLKHVTDLSIRVIRLGRVQRAGPPRSRAKPLPKDKKRDRFETVIAGL